MPVGVPQHPERRGGFGPEAERYDEVRPRYPDRLFTAVRTYSGLAAGGRALYVAAGTGIATGALLRHGWAVSAVELDPAMAGVLTARFGDSVEVVVGAFEDAPPPHGPVDLVLCATAFHWLDPARRVEAVARALRADGTAAVIWTRHVAGGTREFFDAVEECYAAFGEDAGPLPDESSLDSHAEEFRVSAEFADVERHLFVEEIAYPTAAYLDLLRTYSETLALPDDRREALLACIGGRLDRDFGGRAVKRYAFELVLARRR